MNLFHNMLPPKKRPAKLEELIEEIKEVRENVTGRWEFPDLSGCPGAGPGSNHKISTEDWRGMLDNIEGLNLHPYYQKPQSEPVVEEGRHEKGYPHPSVME